MSEKLIFAPETYQYDKLTLMESQLAKTPIDQFNFWFNEINKTNEPIPESLTFSTSNLQTGRISSRIVLLKELDKRGFIIYSNWDNSRKSIDINSNKFASMTFFWKELQRQVRIEGEIEFLSYNESSDYFKTRPRGSKIGAWASPQSQIVNSREELDILFKNFEDKFKDLSDDEIPCPPKWGGIRLVPLSVEFWQGRKSRFHDRLVYSRNSINDSEYKISRLAP